MPIYFWKFSLHLNALLSLYAVSYILSMHHIFFRHLPAKQRKANPKRFMTCLNIYDERKLLMTKVFNGSNIENAEQENCGISVDNTPTL